MAAADAERRLVQAAQALAREKAGRPLEWTDADLDTLSAVSEPDIQQALAFWRANAPTALRTLLDAITEDLAT